MYYCHAKINCIFIIVESNPKENSSPSSSSEVLGSSPQVPSSCPQVPGSSSQASSSSSQVKSHSISEVTDLFPEKHVHHHDICETKCFESSKSFCLTEKENKKTYKLQHSWLENKKMSYCETTNLWWAIFSEGEGLYCYLCRKHDTMNTQNKTKDFQQRSKRIRPEAFADHCKTVQHHNAISSEMLQKVSFFQREISEREKVADEVLVKVFETVNWIIKEELPNCKVRPMLLLLERLGLKEMRHFQHRSQTALSVIIDLLGKTVQGTYLREVGQGSCYGLMVDEVTDISVAEQMVTFIQYYSKADGKVKTQFLSVNDLLEDAESADAKTITKTIFNNLEKFELDKKGLCAFVSDGAAVMTGVKSGVATLLKKENPQVISVHCICHRLALACTDTLQNVGYIKNVHTWLMQLWNMLQKSPKKMASFLQIQLRIKNLQLTTQE